VSSTHATVHNAHLPTVLPALSASTATAATSLVDVSVHVQYMEESANKLHFVA